MKALLKYTGFAIIGAAVTVTFPIWIIPALCIYMGKGIYEEGFDWSFFG